MLYQIMCNLYLDVSNIVYGLVDIISPQNVNSPNTQTIKLQESHNSLTSDTPPVHQVVCIQTQIPLCNFTISIMNSSEEESNTFHLL